MFRILKQRKANKAKSADLFDRIVAQARLPVFYESLHVPDTVDGRFEMIALHSYIVMHRLTRVGDKKLSQALFDAFFTNMERSLREMGVGDLGVPKHMKRMMQGFNGRCRHYEQALNNDDRAELKDALIRNVYGTVDAPDDDILSKMMQYIQASVEMDVIDAEFASIDAKLPRACAHEGLKKEKEHA